MVILLSTKFGNKGSSGIEASDIALGTARLRVYFGRRLNGGPPLRCRLAATRR
jgi:hypothetical protein